MKPQTVTLTQRVVVANVGDPELSAEQVANIESHLGKIMRREFEKAFRTVPQFTSVLETKPPPACSCGPIMHRANCKYALLTT